MFCSEVKLNAGLVKLMVMVLYWSQTRCVQESTTMSKLLMQLFWRSMKNGILLGENFCRYACESLCATAWNLNILSTTVWADYCCITAHNVIALLFVQLNTTVSKWLEFVSEISRSCHATSLSTFLISGDKSVICKSTGCRAMCRRSGL